MKTFYANGETVTLPAAAAAYTVDVPALIGNGLFGVPMNTTAIGADATFRVIGVFSINKATSVTPAVGDKAYWDDTNKVVTTTSSGNTLVGRFWNAPAAGDVTVLVKLTSNMALA